MSKSDHGFISQNILKQKYENKESGYVNPNANENDIGKDG